MALSVNTEETSTRLILPVVISGTLLSSNNNTRLIFPAGTLRFCANTDQNMPGMNILANTTSLTRGNSDNDTLIQQQSFAKKKKEISLTKKCYLGFRSSGVKHVAYYPSLKASVLFDDVFQLWRCFILFLPFSNCFTVHLPEDLFSCRTGNRDFLMGIRTRTGLFLWSSMRVGLIIVTFPPPPTRCSEITRTVWRSFFCK